MSELAVLGNVAIDVIDGGPPKVGGGPFHCGQGLRLLQRRGRIVAKCAPADRTLVARPLTALGLPVTMLDAQQTASFELRYEGEIRTTVLRAAGDPWSPEDVERVGDVQWVHVAPLVQTDFPADALAQLAEGRRVSYDGQGLVRCAELGPVRFDGEFDRDVLQHISFLKLAEEEASAFMPRVTDDAIFRLGVPEVVVTLGSRGSIVYANGESTPVPCRTDPRRRPHGLRRRVRRRVPRGALGGVGRSAPPAARQALVALLLTNRRGVIRR
jgi:hypothetical protein